LLEEKKIIIKIIRRELPTGAVDVTSLTPEKLKLIKNRIDFK